MKTLLSVKITESHKGKFADLAGQFGHFRLSRILQIHFDFTFFSGPAQSPGVSSPCSQKRCWLSALTIHGSSRQQKIFHCPSTLHTCQCSMPELITLSFSTKS